MQVVVGFAFGPCLLDTRSRSLTREGEPVALSTYQYRVLHLLVLQAGVALSKDALISAGWRGTAVGDNSLAKLVGQLRHRLDKNDPNRYIKAVPRRGYQFVAAVTPVLGPEGDPELELMLAPHRAWMEGRVALESLQCDRIGRARATFQRLLEQHPGDATYHIGMANACVMQFEATRTDPAPDADALRLAAAHAQHACRLSPDLAEAWATLGFVLERTGRRDDAIAALQRAVALEPDNWRHQVRLSLGSWGETRLRSARRALAECPHLPMAHWLAASVFVARDALDRAEREVDCGLETAAMESPEASPFSVVALHWLKGLLCLARGADDEAMESFDRELSLESRGHLYSREAAANTWYAKGACLLRQGDREAARAAFREAVARVSRHSMAHAGLAIVDDHPFVATPGPAAPGPVDLSVASAARLAWAGDVPGAVRIATAALGTAPPGNGGWLLPIEPLLHVRHAREPWTPALAALHLRAR
jgi:DNA-binding winged helix-turn-helix (wHTH) protein